MPPIRAILETALYVADVERAAGFYRGLFAFPELFRDSRLCALDVAGRQVLLLFLRGASTRPVQLPGGLLPPHDGHGQSHFAFAIDAEDLAQWRGWLSRNGVDVEGEVRWERGGTSLYFRDPDGHLVELATPGLWTTY